ncbi:hypothetical protein DFH44_000257 [Clostridium beijerinckii]|nr:hypothetical protein [Clostridium beijerinckii]NRT94378.1 hypothetical protein [Clostridium beijerinckii]NRU27087.1 hypothetical protein [Clostridium beijerinckii]NRU63212.1 hypothetical protein [Clostridium beijerinckii]NRU67152.1 hypothetical protein [Clostridium beijerinckii]
MIGFSELEVGNQYDAKACDELSSVLNLPNRGDRKSYCYY